MDFLFVRPVNFLTIGDGGTIQLQNRGLNLIQGANEDDPSATSNGAGKSSIPDALCWAWFGTTARGESGDAVVNHLAKKDCSVESHLQDGAVTYGVTRYRKHATWKNHVRFYVVDDGTGGTHDLTKGTDAETQKCIEDTLGCSYEVFRAAIYAGQEQMPDLPAMTDKQLKMIIEQAAGVERLEKAYALALKRETAATQELAQVTRDRDTNQGALNRQLVDLEAFKIKHKEYEDGRAGKRAALDEQAAEFHAKAINAVAQIKLLNEAEVLAKLEEADSKLKSVAQLQTSVALYEKQTIQPLVKAVAGAEAEYDFLRKQTKLIRDQYDNAEQELSKPCDKCGKPHTPDDLEQLRATIKKSLVQKGQEAIAAGRAFTEAKEKLEEATSKLEALRAKIPDVSDLLTQKTHSSNTLQTITKLKGEAKALVTQVTNLREQSASMATSPNPHDSSIEHLSKNIQGYEKTIASQNEQIAKLTEKLEVAKDVVKVFSPAGVRAHILDTVTPFLNERTAEYLSTMSDGNISAVWSTLSRTAKGELREKFVIDVENEKGAKSFKGLSGGEKKKVRLATCWALQDLVASRASKPINIWIGDEVDEALDESGLERLMTILERKARDKGTVLLISHNSLKEWVDQTTVVRKSGGRSTIEGSLVVP